ncbi:MAG TPA: amino acid permease [bacterium]|nr:amino acid permease [bacterium]HPP02089.1 amino acid permease [bacterium]
MIETTKSAAIHLPKSFGVFDLVSIFVGIIIGSAIYQTPSTIAGILGSPVWIMVVWMLGGLLSFLGALVYAELASTYPREGGDYFFLHHAYGPWAGFLYAWGRMVVIHTGNIASMAYIAGNYGTGLAAFPHSQTVYALAAVILLTGINCLGIRQGKWTQNLLTSTKVIGLVGVIAVALFVRAAPAEAIEPVASEGGITFGGLFMALIFVQFTFGGWSDCAFVASEVKNPERNILRSLLLGMALVTAIYLLVNVALMLALGVSGMAASHSVMADVLNLGFGRTGAGLLSALVILSALGSVNGMILTGARIFHAFGTDHTLFRFLGHWDQKKGAPLVAFLVQGIISAVMVLLGSFESLIIYTTAAHWIFLSGVGASLFVFRYREPGVTRPYRVHLYPFIPILYIASCLMLVYSSLTYANTVAPYGALIGFLLVLSGLPFYWLSNFYQESKHGPQNRQINN